MDRAALSDGALHIVFDGPPGPEAGRFVECETPDGRSINAGEWHERADGLWELRLTAPRPLEVGEGEVTQAMVEAGQEVLARWSLGKNGNGSICSEIYRAMLAVSPAGQRGE